MENTLNITKESASYQEEYPDRINDLNNYYYDRYLDDEDWLRKCVGIEKMTVEQEKDSFGQLHFSTTVAMTNNQAIILDYPNDILITDKDNPNHVYDGEWLKNKFEERNYLNLEPDGHMDSTCLRIAVMAKIESDKYNIKFEDRLNDLIESHKRGLYTVEHTYGENVNNPGKVETYELSKNDSRLLKNIMESIRDGYTQFKIGIELTHEGIQEAGKKVQEWTLEKCANLQHLVHTGANKVVNAYENVLQIGRNISNAYYQSQYTKGAKQALKEIRAEYVEKVNLLSKEDEKLQAMKKELDVLGREKNLVYEAYKEKYMSNVRNRESANMAKDLVNHVQDESRELLTKMNENPDIAKMKDSIKEFNDIYRDYEIAQNRLSNVNSLIKNNEVQMKNIGEEYREVSKEYTELKNTYETNAKNIRKALDNQTGILNKAEEIVKAQDEKRKEAWRNIFNTKESRS